METNTCFSVDTKSSKKHFSESDDFRHAFSRIFRFPILFLKVGGFNIPGTDGNLASVGGTPCPLSTKAAFGVLYRMFIALLHVASAGRVVGFWITTIHAAKDADIARSLLASFIMLYGSSLFVCDHFALRFYFDHLLQTLESYNHEFRLLGSTFKQEKRVKGSTLVIVIFNLVSIVFWAALDVSNSDRFVTNPFNEKDLSTTALVFVHLVFFTHMFLMNIPIYGCLLMYTLVLGILQDEFRCTAKMMSNILKKSEVDKTEARFDRCRERHQSLCQSVVILSKLTRTFVFANIFYNMMIICVSIYGLSSADLTGEVFIFQFLSGIVVNLCTVLFLTGRWGQLSTAAHSISDAIVDWSQASSRLLHKMNLLVTCCSTSKIGVDVFGLFTLDSSMPLMVIGTLVTYGVVVLQFQLDHEIEFCGKNSTS